MGPAPELGVCFPWTTFVFHLLLLFLLLQLLQFLQFLPIALWHARLGHASSSRVQQLASRGLLGSVSTENFDCVSCQLGKQSVLPFNSSESISNDIFDLIHFDVWGPSPVFSIGGSRYIVVFVDDYSCYNWIFHMKHRSELLQVYSNFAKMVETQFSKRIKIF